MSKGKYQSEDYWLIQYQILQIYIIRNVWQTVRRIANEILGVKGLMIILLDLELLSTKNMLEENGPIGKKLLWDVFGNK